MGFMFPYGGNTSGRKNKGNNYVNELRLAFAGMGKGINLMGNGYKIPKLSKPIKKNNVIKIGNYNYKLKRIKK